MTETAARRLPRGRHGLSRDAVAASQRLRILAAMADAMMEKGYVATSVADVIKRAGVSRETFYQQFSSKADCFMAAFETAGQLLVAAVESGAGVGPATGDPADTATRLAHFDALFTAYLETLATNPAPARLFLVEVFAAGPAAIRARGDLQRRIVDRLVTLLGADDGQGRFACEVLVAAIGAMVTEPLVSGDVQRLRDLRAPVVALVERALATDCSP